MTSASVSDLSLMHGQKRSNVGNAPQILTEEVRCAAVVASSGDNSVRDSCNPRSAARSPRKLIAWFKHPAQMFDL